MKLHLYTISHSYLLTCSNSAGSGWEGDNLTALCPPGWDSLRHGLTLRGGKRWPLVQKNLISFKNQSIKMIIPSKRWHGGEESPRWDTCAPGWCWASTVPETVVRRVLWEEPVGNLIPARWKCNRCGARCSTDVINCTSVWNPPTLTVNISRGTWAGRRFRQEVTHFWWATKLYFTSTFYQNVSQFCENHISD